jgi:hypothetical protein
MPKCTDLRTGFHQDLLTNLLSISDDGIPNIADKGSRPSIEIAVGLVERLGEARKGKKVAGQTAGADFETICARYIEAAFGAINHLRPGEYKVSKGGSIAQFDQYQHLDELEAIASSSKEIATAIGSDYIIKPDIVVSKLPFDDNLINAQDEIVGETHGSLTPLRRANDSAPTLHASLSCKWTVRSDRAQNARSEGLNLVRNRKGRLPHIGVITAEPTPNRIASLALGTGDIDCVYHIALDELTAALRDQGRDDALEMLMMMIDGRRLRDISDLAFDIAV